MSGLVGSLRSQTTQERLRSDHIMTLELFQATVDENAELKLELGRLKAKLASSSADTEEGEVEDGESAKSGGATLVQKVLKQEKELKDLREEVKVLKAKGVGFRQSGRGRRRASSVGNCRPRGAGMGRGVVGKGVPR